MLKVSLLFQAIERVTGPVRRMGAGIKRMSRDGERDVGRVGRALDRLRSNSLRAGNAIRTNLSSAISAALSRMRVMAERGGLAVGRTIGRTLRAGLLLGSAAVGATVGALLYRLTFGAIQTASTFEQFQVVLENTEGSAAGARRAMAWVRNFATTTPYEVADVMEAFVRLRAYGIDPTSGALRSLGNASSGMNKSIMDAVEMLADAQTGEFERLKEFGIRAQVTGNQVRFTYMRNNREMTRTTRKSAAEIQRAITGIFDERFAGMMDRQSRTLAGMWSNIKDQIAGFELNVANAGFFDFVKARVQGLLDKVNELAANGTLQRWAQQVSDWLVRAGTSVVAFMRDTDWRRVGRDIASIATAFRDVAASINSVLGPLRTVTGWLDSIPGLRSISDTAALPAVTIPQRMRGWVTHYYDLAGERDRARAEAAQRGRRGPATPNPRAFAPGLPGPGRLPGRGPLRFSPTMRGAPLRQQTTLIRQRTEVGGRVAVTVSPPAGWGMSVTGLSSANPAVPLDVRRGVARTG